MDKMKQTPIAIMLLCAGKLKFKIDSFVMCLCLSKNNIIIQVNKKQSVIAMRLANYTISGDHVDADRALFDKLLHIKDLFIRISIAGC